MPSEKIVEEDEQRRSPESPPARRSPAEATAAALGQTLIPVVNKLQDICAQSGVSLPMDLPQVAVVGSQSSGKSSVIEALVGRDFLPRGPDIVTRRPLVLQLIQTKPNDDGSIEEYGEFLHLPGQKFYDFAQIRREIQAETDREAGANRGISEKTIRLKIYSPNVLDITLIDLPGMTRVPVGDQPSDIEARIRTMIMKYIRHPSCIILAVTPANSDLANSDALQIAGNADPDGKRTIGVITKLDIMDRGTDARNMLLGKIIPLQLGYVGVVNRSQEDIMLNRSIKDALAAEERFFRSHPAYINLADRCGIPQLAKKLNQILVQHIRQCLPGLKSRISSQLVSVTKEYASYGQIPESRAGQGTLLLNILSKYSEAFSSLVEGKSEGISTSELSGGARIHYIFQSIYVKSLEDVDPCDGLSDEDIRIAIQNARGPRSAVFVPDIYNRSYNLFNYEVSPPPKELIGTLISSCPNSASLSATVEVPFEVLVKRQIARLLDPSRQCARFIYNELVKMSHSCMVSELQRYPVLRKQIDHVVGRFLRDNLDPAENIIGHIIAMEMDYINTSHPNFIGGSKALDVAQQRVRSASVVPVPRQRDVVENDVMQGSERGSRPRGIVGRSTANGFIKPPSANGVVVDQGARSNTHAETERSRPPASSMWGISALFSGGENQSSAREAPRGNAHREPTYTIEHALSTIHLQEPPTVLRASETPSELEAIEIAATKLLLSSYFDIVRKIIEDSVPKAVMHFLVNHTKRELHNVLIQKLYRENLFEEMLQEPGEVALKRKRTWETLQVLQQAFQTLDELPLEAESIERGYSRGTDSIGLPRAHGLPSTSSYASSMFP